MNAERSVPGEPSRGEGVRPLLRFARPIDRKYHILQALGLERELDKDFALRVLEYRIITRRINNTEYTGGNPDRWMIDYQRRTESDVTRMRTDYQENRERAGHIENAITAFVAEGYRERLLHPFRPFHMTGERIDQLGAFWRNQITLS